MASAVRSLFVSRTNSYFDDNTPSLGVLPSICEVLRKYDLLNYFEKWFTNSTFPKYPTWKIIVNKKIREFEQHVWLNFANDHPNMHVAQACIDNISPVRFWSIADQYPDIVSRLHIQVRLMGNFGLNGGIPWLSNTDGALCFICKGDVETVNHFLFDCPYFRENFDTLWSNLISKVTVYNQTDGLQISQFIMNLDQYQKILLLLGSLPLPFDCATVTLITRFTAVAVGKIYKIRTEKLRELEAPWLSK